MLRGDCAGIGFSQIAVEVGAIRRQANRTRKKIARLCGLVTVSSTLFGPSATSTPNRNILNNIVGAAGPSGFDNVAITLGNITSADVGLTAYVKISQNVAASSSASGALTIQSGAD